MKRSLLLFFLWLMVSGAFSPPALYAQGSDGQSSLLQKAISEYQEERFEEALELLILARQQVPASSVAAFYLGLVYKQTGDYAKAASQYREALRLSPRVQDAYIELIEVLIRMEEIPEARMYILQAESEGVLPDQIAFLKGLTLARMGNSQKAIAAFRKSMDLNPALTTSAELQIAILHVQEGKIRQAKNSLEALSTMAPDPDQADFAREYSQSLTRLMETHRKWRFSLGAEVRYDDNVVAKPSSTITGVDITGEKDTGLLTTFQASFNPLLDRPWSLNAQFALSANTYKDTSSHNILLPSMALTPAWHFRQGNLGLPLFWNRAWLHEREYMDTMGLRPTLFFQLHPSHMVRLSAGYARREMLQSARHPDENRDSHVYSAATAYFYSFAQAQGLFHLRYEYIQDDAEGANWQNQGHRYGAGLLFPIHAQVRISLSAEHFKQDYDKVHSVFGLKRNNRSNTWTSQILWDISPKLLFTLSYTGNEDDSNIPIYAYRRNVYGAGMEYRF